MPAEPALLSEPQWRAEGYQPCPKQGPFVPSFAEVFVKTTAEDLVFRVRVQAAHCNGFGILHGGFVATMADIVLGYNVGYRLPNSVQVVTANLTVDYLRAVKPGQILDSVVDRCKIGGRLCHASGALISGDEIVAAMRASFAVLGG